ncbi:MAG: hypothetical protein PHH13_02465 [Candidatus Peribacteraceae bacterium]|nr:hypothetical protein [Candidatus Peribacteraceae bacterium]
MANRDNHLVVTALAGLIMGALLGAGTVQYAQVVAFSGVNPNTAATSDSARAGLSTRQRSYIDEYPLVPRYVNGTTQTTEQSHAAAWEGVPAHCQELTGRRLINCWASWQDGILYKANEMN